MGKALYRKYRPTKLTDVVGQDNITNTLAASLKSGKFSHAYLFTGPRGTGKTSIARIFAHAINDFDYQLEDDYVDIIEIDAASNTGVDNIRDLRESAIIAPTKGQYKVYIIDEIHMLSKSAFNALLKILEEPPEHVIFIMATTDPQKVPITITSRSQVYTFNLAPPAVMQKHLRSIADAENIQITDAALDIIVRRGGGSFRDSISLLDQISNLSDHEITPDDLNQALGLPQDQLIDRLLSAYVAKDSDQISALLKDLLSSGAKPETIAEAAITKIIESPSPTLLPLLGALPRVAQPFPEAKLLLSFLWGSGNGAESARASRVAPPVRPHATANRPPQGEPPAAKPQSEQPSATPQLAAQPAEESTTSPTSAPTEFDWDSFLAAVQNRSRLLFNFLANAHYRHEGGTLHIYVKNQGIINSPNNKALLGKLAGDLQIITHDPSEFNSQNFGKISDIMGNVEEVNDHGNPFN